MTVPTSFSRSAPVPGATKRPSSRATFFACTPKFAENHRWDIEILNERPGEHGGYKEIITRVAGKRAYSQLKFESGVHRVQRVPDTESQGRIHTSACTVAVLPEVDDIDAVDIDKSDLRVDLFRASGAGGQHVNRDRLGSTLDAPADGHRGRMPGRTLPAQEPGPGHGFAASEAGGCRALRTAGGAGRVAP